VSVVCVLGAGRMGTAICTPLLDNGHEIRLVGTHLDGAYIGAMRSNGVHPGLLHALPPGATYHEVGELPEAMNGADAVLIGVSSAGIAWAAQALAGLIKPGTPLLFITKGLEWDGSELRIEPDAFLDGIPEPVRSTLKPVGVTGPCIAGELIRRVDTCVAFASRDKAAREQWAGMAANSYYNVWPSADVVGCEAASALKNSFSIATGFAAGRLEAQGAAAGGSAEISGVAAHNYEAAVFAESVVEMGGLVQLMGGRLETVNGLVGIGDLNVTAHARSARFGRLLGRGLSVDEAVEQMAGATLEGLAAIRTVGRALAAWDARGRTKPGQFPLMRHLVEVAGGARVNVPFGSFFGDQA
jgi:glycerol-3-phosphate dehydrogenase (NAD(P)+)